MSIGTRTKKISVIHEKRKRTQPKMLRKKCSFITEMLGYEGRRLDVLLTRSFLTDWRKAHLATMEHMVYRRPIAKASGSFGRDAFKRPGAAVWV